MEFTPTPTTNASLPFINADFRTLTEGLDYAARGETGYNYYSMRGDLQVRLPYARLRDEARDAAVRLAQEFPRGSRLGIVAQTDPNFHILFFACQYAGMLPVPLPLPVNLGGRDSYIRQIRQMAQSSGAAAIAAPSDLLDFAKEAAQGAGEDGGDIQAASFEEFRGLPLGETPAVPFRADELCYIQYSSGSTSAPKGVIGTQKSVTSNLFGILNYGIKVNAQDRAVTWLPLYHDMGLIGFALAPLMSQITIDYVATSDFVRRPMVWPKLISENRGTMAFSPSFGYDLCARRMERHSVDGYDLRSWRIAGIGGDMVRPDALERFASVFEPAGFPKTSFIPSYGLAEATLAVSFASLEDEFTVDEIDMQHYTRSQIAQAPTALTRSEHSRRFVVCGGPLPKHELEVRSEDGAVLPDRRMGRILMRGPSVSPGYFRNQDATDAILSADGWMDTGDMGYMLDGQVVVTGRSKDLILYNGRNIWPQDIEWAVEKLPDVRDGSVAAFSIDDAEAGESVVTLVEARAKTAEYRQSLIRDIAAAVHSAAGVPSEIVLVPTRSMSLTSSGKLSRAKMKARYLEGEFEQAEPVAEPAPRQAAEA
ncbi:MAG: fatty acyl-AMP ligase [Pseudomonadota bacterium]